MGRAPSQVWMVNRRTGPEGWSGWLLLQEDRLVFRPDDERAADVEFPLERIRGVRRVHGSPVLELSFVQPFEFRAMGFYFIRPPSLARQDSTGLIFKKRAARTQSIARLRSWNRVMKNEVSDWAKSIDAARRERARS